MATDAKTTAARAFVRSFNVLLKFARLYGMEHARCAAQLDIVCKELRAALPPGNESGLLLSASGSQLLLDGVPLEATPAERSFAQMLSGAEISSLHFLPSVTREDLSRLATSFPTGSGKRALGDALQKAFAGAGGIRVNTISYVPTDSSAANLAAAASITARALGMEGEQLQSLMDDPSKLIQLISAAEGARGGSGGGGGGAGTGGAAGGGGFGGGAAGGGVGIGGGAGPGPGGTGGSGSGGTGGAGGGSAGGGGVGPGTQGVGIDLGSILVPPGAPAGVSGSPRPARTASFAELISAAFGGVGESGGETAGTGGGFAFGGGGSGHRGGSGGGGGVGGGAPAGAGSGFGGGGGGVGVPGSSSGPGTGGGGIAAGGGSGRGEGGFGGGGGGVGSGLGSGGAGETGAVGAGGGTGAVGGAGGGFGGGSGAGGGSGPGGRGPGSSVGGASVGGGIAGVGRASGGAGTPAASASAGSVFDLIDAGAGGGAGAAQETAEPPGRWETASAGLYAGLTSRPRRRVDFAEVERWGVGLGQLAEGEEDLTEMLGILRQFVSFAKQPEKADDLPAFQQRLTAVPLRVQRNLREALNSLAAQVTPERPGDQVMLQLAEHMAIQYALKSFQGGGASRVSAVRELIERMGREIDDLRKTVHGHEALLAKEGVSFRPYSEQLNDQFWESVPDEARREVLKSKEAWCVSPQSVRRTVEAHFAEGDAEGAAGILSYYAQSIASEHTNARRVTAMGLTELGDLYARAEDLLADTIRHVGTQVSRETDGEVRSLTSAAFVRLSTEAVSRRSYPGMIAATQTLKPLQSQDSALADSLLQRTGVQDRLPELVEEALSSKEAPQGLGELLALLPRPAMECLAERFSQSGFREDCNLLLGLARKTGADGVSFLRETFRDSKAPNVVETVGLLSRLDPEALSRYLPGRVREWPRSMHDRLVRYLAGSGAHDRGRLILSILEDLDPLVRPMALDEVGLVGDDLCLPRLLELARGGIPAGSGPYLQVKAIEALGRARAPEAVALLRPLVEAKKMFGWVHPHEMRLAAAQALQRIDAQWAQDFLPRSGLTPEELAVGPVDPDPNSACNRQRRYVRFRLHHSVAGVAVKENARVDVAILSLSGGAGACEQRFASGTLITLRLGGRLRPATLQAFVRTFRANVLGFEFAEMDLEERHRLRRLIVETGGVPLSDTPLNRSRVIRPRIKR